MRQILLTFVAAAALHSVGAFTVSRMPNHIIRSKKTGLHMSDYESQILAAQPTIEEWLDVADPGLKKATLAMFRSVKEIAYKIRTASCDKMSCFNDFGKRRRNFRLVFLVVHAIVIYFSDHNLICAGARAVHILITSFFR